MNRAATLRGIALICLLAVLWGATCEAAHANGYATDNRGVIYRVSPETKKFTKLGTVVVQPSVESEGDEDSPKKLRDSSPASFTPILTDLALSTEHGLYGISYSDLFKIDMTDPSRSKLVGSLGGGTSFNALAFGPEGRVLYALGFQSLFQVDLKTGAAKLIGRAVVTGGSDGDLAFVNGKLYGTFAEMDGSHLVELDPKTGKGKDIGVIRRVMPAKDVVTPKKDGARESGVPLHSVWGLIWDGYKTWALTSDGHVLELELKTARATPRFRTPLAFYGACPMLRL